jgi:hypothetical protein
MSFCNTIAKHTPAATSCKNMSSSMLLGLAAEHYVEGIVTCNLLAALTLQAQVAIPLEASAAWQ